MLSWPSETTPVMGTGKAWRTSVSSAVRSLVVADSRLRASSTSPERQSRSTHRTSWPTSGCRPSMASTDAALLAQEGVQPLAVGRGQGAQFVVAVQEVGDGAQGDGDAAAGQLLVDLGDAAVLGVAEASDQGDDVEAELVVGQGEVGLGLGAVGAVVAGAVGVGTAADAQGEARDGVEGGDGAVVGVGGPEEVTALGAVSGDGVRVWACVGRGRRRVRAMAHPPLAPSSFYSTDVLHPSLPA